MTIKVDSLTRNELVKQYIRDGLSQAEIGARLGLSRGRAGQICRDVEGTAKPRVYQPCRVCGGEKEHGSRYYCNRCKALLDSIPGNDRAMALIKAQALIGKGKTKYEPPKPLFEKCFNCEWNKLKPDSKRKIYCFPQGNGRCAKKEGFIKRSYGADLITIYVRQPYEVSK